MDAKRRKMEPHGGNQRLHYIVFGFLRAGGQKTDMKPTVETRTGSRWLEHKHMLQTNPFAEQKGENTASRIISI
jgi:hypothetical protein